MPAEPRLTTTLKFSGRIAGVGTASGTRFVVGMWKTSPFGTFADVMIEEPGGARMLIAPRREIAHFVGRIYGFDEVRVAPVAWGRDGADPGETALHVRAGVGEEGVELRFRVGGSTPVGRVLRAVPRGLATHPLFSAIADPFARLLLPGTRTIGRTADGALETYGVTGVRDIVRATATRGGVDLGPLAPIDPPVRFGFASTPTTPCLIDVVSTIVVSSSEELRPPE